MREKDKAFKKARRTCLQVDWDRAKQLRNYLSTDIKNAKSNFLKRELDNSKAHIPLRTGFASGQVCVANAKKQPEIDMPNARPNAKLPTRSIFHWSCIEEVLNYFGWCRGLAFDRKRGRPISGWRLSNADDERWREL